MVRQDTDGEVGTQKEMAVGPNRQQDRETLQFRDRVLGLRRGQTMRRIADRHQMAVMDLSQHATNASGAGIAQQDVRLVGVVLAENGVARHGRLQGAHRLVLRRAPVTSPHNIFLQHVREGNRDVGKIDNPSSVELTHAQ